MAIFNPCYMRKLLMQHAKFRQQISGFVSLSNTCNMLPQRDIALKVALCGILNDIDF